MIRELCCSLLWTKCWDFGFNSSITHPDKPKVDYPECFQGKQIPVHGPFVAKLIEDRVLSGDVPLHWPSSCSDMEFYLRPPTHHNNTVFFPILSEFISGHLSSCTFCSSLLSNIYSLCFSPPSLHSGAILLFWSQPTGIYMLYVIVTMSIPFQYSRDVIGYLVSFSSMLPMDVNHSLNFQ